MIARTEGTLAMLPKPSPSLLFHSLSYCYRLPSINYFQLLCSSNLSLYIYHRHPTYSCKRLPFISALTPYHFYLRILFVLFLPQRRPVRVAFVDVTRTDY